MQTKTPSNIRIFLPIFLCMAYFGITPSFTSAQEVELFSEEELGKKPIYNNTQRAYQDYEKVYRLALKGSGGYYGKVDAVPPDIDTLKNLQYFYVVNEELSDLPPRFGNLLMLQQLYLSGNLFEEIPDTVLTMKNLKRLDMRANQLKSVPAEIENLENLEYLYLNDNRNLEALPYESIARLKKLKVLNVENTKIPREEMRELEKLLPTTKISYD